MQYAPTTRKKKMRKKYLMGVCNTPLQTAKKDEKKIFNGRMQYAPTKGKKDEKKYLLGTSDIPLSIDISGNMKREGFTPSLSILRCLLENSLFRDLFH